MKNWAFYIKNILRTHALAYLWINQLYINMSFVVIKQRIIDTFLQKGYADINNSSRLQTKCISKHEFESEMYFDCIKEKKMQKIHF